MRTRLTELLGIEVPIVQAPMAGHAGSALAIEVARAGGLASLPCAGSADFTPLWSGQAGALARAVPAGELVRAWVDEVDRRSGTTGR